jgi:hypothetical protein
MGSPFTAKMGITLLTGLPRVATTVSKISSKNVTID